MEVIKEVPVTVERVVYKDVLVPVENGVPVAGGGVTLWGEKSPVAQEEEEERSATFSETVQPAQYEHRSIISEQVRPSEYMTSEHIRSPQVMPQVSTADAVIHIHARTRDTRNTHLDYACMHGPDVGGKKVVRR